MSDERKPHSDDRALLRDLGARAADRVANAAEALAEQALRESEERYRTLFESIDEGFCIIEMLFDERDNPTDYRFLTMNPAFVAQTGLADAKGRTIREMVPEHEEHWFQIYGKIALTGQPTRFEHEASYLDPPRWYDVYAFRYGSAAKRQVAVLFKDVAPRKRAEEALKKANLELAEAHRRKDEFIAMLGHELRNPLAAIRNATEMLKHMPRDDPRLARAHGVLDRQSTQMTHLIDGLLEVSRIARGKIQLNRETLDAREVVHQVLQVRRAHAEARGLQLAEDLPSESVWLNADHARIAQVLDNLLGNAVKFTDSGGSIRVIVRVDNGCALIRVRDTGIGMRPEAIPRLFEPFQQESQELARSDGGLGLGLALAKGLVELHDGTIEAHSAGLGAGAEFRVRWPLAACPAPRGAREPAKATTRRRILVVEDNPDAGQSLRDLLEMLGHSVEVVESGPEALEVLSQQRTDVVLCDLGLPGMSGYDIAHTVRSTASLANLWLVAVTGYGQPEDRRKAREVGFDVHLTKPVEIEKLNEALRGP